MEKKAPAFIKIGAAIMMSAITIAIRPASATDFSATGEITGVLTADLIVDPPKIDLGLGNTTVVFGNSYNTASYQSLYYFGNLSQYYAPNAISAPAYFVDASSLPATSYASYFYNGDLRPYNTYNIFIRGAGTYSYQLYDPAYPFNFVRNTQGSPITIDLIAALYVKSGNFPSAFNPNNVLENLISLNDDTDSNGLSNPFTMFYINSDPNACVTLTLVYYPWFTVPNGAPVGIRASGPGQIATSCAALGPDPIYTLAALRSTATATSSVLNATQARMASLVDYDTNTFGKYDISVSMAVRHGSLASSSDEGAGALIAAYRLTPKIRVGAFLDYAMSGSLPTGIKQEGDGAKTVGAFAVYQDAADNSGTTARISYAYGWDKISTTRDASLDNTEAGFGSAPVIGKAFATEIGYGWRISDTFVLQPYLGARHVSATRSAYVEQASASVSYPLNFNDFGQWATIGTSGVRFFGRYNARLGYFIGIGGEYNVAGRCDPLSGTSTIVGLESFSVPVATRDNRVRLSMAAGASYDFAENQKLSFDVGVRQTPYSRVTAVNTMLKYSIGF